MLNIQDMESTKCEKERLAQKCHDLEMQLNLMKEEKSNLSGTLGIPICREHYNSNLSGTFEFNVRSFGIPIGLSLPLPLAYSICILLEGKPTNTHKKG